MNRDFRHERNKGEKATKSPEVEDRNHVSEVQGRRALITSACAQRREKLVVPEVENAALPKACNTTGIREWEKGDTQRKCRDRRNQEQDLCYNGNAQHYSKLYEIIFLQRRNTITVKSLNKL